MRELQTHEVKTVAGGKNEPLPPGNAYGWYVNGKAKGKPSKDAPSGIEKNDQKG